MSRKSSYSVFAVAVLVLIGCGQSGAQVEAPDPAAASEATAVAGPDAPTGDGHEAASYGIGLNMGRQFRQQEVEIDVDVLIEGLRAGVAGDEARFTDPQIQAAMQALQQEVMAAQSEKFAALAATNAEEGAAFLETNGAREGVTTTASGLQYEVLQAADGAKPTTSERVKVHYRGTLIDGTQFDSSYDRGEPAVFGLQGIIPGWVEALQLMGVGSKWKLYIPSELGYGAKGSGPTIGPNATLVFEVELLEVVPAEGADS